MPHHKQCPALDATVSTLFFRRPAHKLDFGAFEGCWSAFVSEKLAYFRLKRTKSIAPVATAAR
jgi:hypothetical protein